MLHITKVAVGCPDADSLAERLQSRAADGESWIVTRYRPTRHEELIGGSLYWIIKHTLVARSPILGFGEAEGGRVAIHIDPALVLTEGRPKRAHQGWRYLEGDDAPGDLGEGAEIDEAMPAGLISRLSALALL